MAVTFQEHSATKWFILFAHAALRSTLYGVSGSNSGSTRSQVGFINSWPSQT
jgi:hypothetical protein